GYRYRTEASATNPSDVDVVQAAAPVNGPAFHMETTLVGGRAVAITRNGSAMSAVADAGGAGTAKRAAVDGLRRIMRRLADEQLRLAVERGDQAQRAYASNDADLRSALAVSGVPDLRGA